MYRCENHLVLVQKSNKTEMKIATGGGEWGQGGERGWR